ncbi:MAG: GNAT family N-acetyltransferase [Planctomycetaceae bacterium]
MSEELLRQVDAYLDAVPRTVARAERIGPFTLFVNEGRGWRYYARPTPEAAAVTSRDVDVVRARQRALGQPEEFEWIVDLSPSVGPACAATGLGVIEDRPLMVLPRDRFAPAPGVDGAEVRFVAADEPALAPILAVPAVGFGAPGTAVGDAGAEALASHVDAMPGDVLAFQRERIARGHTVVAAVWVEGHPVAYAAHQPVDGASEVVGVATLPAYRRRGLGALVTSEIAGDAFARGVQTVLLSAGDEIVARVYERIGFTRVGTVGAAAPGLG